MLQRAVGDDAADQRAMQRAWLLSRRAGAHQPSVRVDTLDALLWPDASAPPPRVALMKLDVQGFEVQLLRGARRLLNASAIRTIKFEVATKWLHAQGTTAVALCAYLDGHGFRMTEHTRKGEVRAAACDRFAQLDGQSSAIVDFVARLAPEALGADANERHRQQDAYTHRGRRHRLDLWRRWHRRKRRHPQQDSSTGSIDEG